MKAENEMGEMISDAAEAVVVLVVVVIIVNGTAAAVDAVRADVALIPENCWTLIKTATSSAGVSHFVAIITIKRNLVRKLVVFVVVSKVS